MSESDLDRRRLGDADRVFGTPSQDAAATMTGAVLGAFGAAAPVLMSTPLMSTPLISAPLISTPLSSAALDAVELDDAEHPVLLAASVEEHLPTVEPLAESEPFSAPIETGTALLPVLYTTSPVEDVPVAATELVKASGGFTSALVRRRRGRDLTPRAAKRHIERTLRKVPRERVVVVANSGGVAAATPMRSGLSILLVTGVAAVMAFPLLSNAATVEAVELATPLSAEADAVPKQSLPVDSVAAAVTLEERAGFEVIKPAPVFTFSYSAARAGGPYTTDPSWSIQWPIQWSSPVTDGFGYVATRGRVHYGQDFTPGAGQPIVAIADGVVTAPPGWGALGVHAKISHPQLGVESIYAHMQSGSLMVSPGDTVVAGQVIGLVGSTGLSTGAHLHLEIHVGGAAVDPYAWLTANAGP